MYGGNMSPPQGQKESRMANTNEIVHAYMAAWNEQDEGKRRQLLEKAWADNGRYTDPMADAAGREALAALISQFHKQMPGGAYFPPAVSTSTTAGCGSPGR